MLSSPDAAVVAFGAAVGDCDVGDAVCWASDVPEQATAIEPKNAAVMMTRLRKRAFTPFLAFIGV